MRRLLSVLFFSCCVCVAAQAQEINGASLKYANHVSAGNVAVYFPGRVKTLESAMLLDYFIKYFKSTGQYISEAPPEEDGFLRQFSIRLDRRKNVYVIGIALKNTPGDELDIATKAAWQREARQISFQCFQGAEVQLFLGNGDYTTSEKRMVSSTGSQVIQ